MPVRLGEEVIPRDLPTPRRLRERIVENEGRVQELQVRSSGVAPSGAEASGHQQPREGV